MDDIGTLDIEYTMRSWGFCASVPSGLTARPFTGLELRLALDGCVNPSAMWGRNPCADEPSPRVGGRLIYG